MLKARATVGAAALVMTAVRAMVTASVEANMAVVAGAVAYANS
jgi:hypothetical protein